MDIFLLVSGLRRNGADAAECSVPLAESLVDPSPLEGYRGKLERLHDPHV